jgi:hypothetical protein
MLEVFTVMKIQVVVFRVTTSLHGVITEKKAT